MHSTNKRLFSYFILTILIFINFAPITIHAESLENTELLQNTSSESDLLLYTEIQSADYAEIDKPIIFTAQAQFNTEKINSIKYEWDFGDGNKDVGKEVAHNFAESGKQKITLLVSTDNASFTQTKEIFIAKKAALLISDYTDKSASVENFIKNAENSEIYIPLIESFTSHSQFLSEEVLARKLIKKEALINKMDVILVWTSGGAGLNALSRYKQASENNNFNNTTIILINDNFQNITRIERQFNQLEPKEILIIEESARHKFYDNPNIPDLKNSLISEEYRSITVGKTKITPLNIFSFFIDFLTEKGIPDNTLILLLLIPVIATIISLMKQVVGIKTLGIYTPTIITLTFLLLGLQFGVIILFFIVILGTFTHKALRRLKLLYIPKMALTLTAVSLSIFVLLTITVYLNLFDIEFISLAIFPVIIMGTLTEKFVSLRSEKGLPVSLIITFETFFVAFIAYFLSGGLVDLYFTQFEWNFIQNLILNHPEVLGLTIFINIYIGRWTGLRLTEYFQFSEVFKNIEE